MASTLLGRACWLLGVVALFAGATGCSLLTPIDASGLSWRIYDDPGADWGWPSNSVTTPAGAEVGNTIDILRNGQLIAKLDSGMRSIRPYCDSRTVSRLYLAAEYRKMNNGAWVEPTQFQPTIVRAGSSYVLSVESRTDDGAMQAHYSITIYEDGSMYLDKTTDVPAPLATDECSTEDGCVGVHFGSRPVGDGVHIEVFDGGSLYSWDVPSLSGYGDISASHTLESGDWVSLTEAGSGVAVKFQAQHTAGFDNSGNPSPLAVVIQYGEGSYVLLVGRKDVAMWHPTVLPAGQYTIAGWISATCL